MSSKRRWQKILWEAVGRNDTDTIVRVLDSDERAIAFLANKQRRQIWYNEEAPLHLAAFFGYDSIVELLVERGFDVDSYNFYQATKASQGAAYRVTPLHFAVYKNKIGTVKLLLNLGADPSLFGRWGDTRGTPLQFAKKKRFKELVEILSNCDSFLDEDSQDDDSKDEQEHLKESLRALQSEAARLSKQLEANKRKTFLVQQKLRENFATEEERLKPLEESQDGDPTCIICISLPPSQIFSCSGCDSIFCKACSNRVEKCPVCRAGFFDKNDADFETCKSANLRRNLWAEKLVEANRKLETKKGDLIKFDESKE